MSVAAHGEVIVIGDAVGHGFVFQRAASTWQQQAAFSVRSSTSGSIVQDPADSAAGVEAGVFVVSGVVGQVRFVGSDWRQQPAMPVAKFLYRGAIAVSPGGDLIAVGGVTQSETGRAESIDILEWEDEVLVKKQSLTLPAPRGSKSSLALSEDVLVVASDGGLVRWYARTSAGFGPEPRHTEDLAVGEEVCLSCDVNETGSTVVVGRALCGTAEPTGVGQLWLFERDGDGTVQQASMLASGLPLLLDTFVPVAISGTTIASVVNPPGTTSSIVVYERAAEGWPAEPNQRLAPRSPSLITDVDVSDTVLVAGAYAADSGAGRAYIFEKSSAGFPASESALLRSFRER